MTIYRGIEKINQELTIAEYDGIARPGEIVTAQVDPSAPDFAAYLADANGNLHPLGGGGGNGSPAGATGQLQFNSLGNFGASPNLTFDTGNSVLSATYGNFAGVVTGDMTATGTVGILGDLQVVGDVLPAGNLTSDLGSPTNRWKDLYLSNNTIYLGNTQLSANGSTLLVGNAAVVTSAPNGTVTATSLQVTGTANLGAVGNVKITGGSNAQVLTTDGAGNLSWATPAGGYGDANVAAYLPNYAGDIGTFGGNIANAVIANGLVAMGEIYSAGVLNVDGRTNTGNLTVYGHADIGTVANVTLSGGSNGQVLTTDGNGSLSWTTVSGGGSSNTITNGNSSVGIATADGNAEIIINGGSPWVFDATGNVTLPAGGDINAVADNDLKIGIVDTIQDGYSLRMQVTDGANLLSYTRLQYDNFRISTDVAGNGYSWIFGSDGSLNMPGNLWVYDGNMVISAMDTGAANTSAALQSTSHVNSGVFTSITATPGGANITTNQTNTPYTWTFGDNGDLLVPGNITVGVAASPAPSLNGFSSAQFSVGLTTSNLTATGVSTLGAVGNVKITGGSDGHVLTTDGAGNLSWSAPAVSNYGNANVAAYLPTYTGNIGTYGSTPVATLAANYIIAETEIYTLGQLVTDYNLSVGGLANITGALTVGGVSTLGAVGNVKITGGSNAQVLTTDGTGNLSWATPTAAAAGNTGFIQFNSNGTFSADSSLNYDLANATLNATYVAAQQFEASQAAIVRGELFTFGQASMGYGNADAAMIVAVDSNTAVQVYGTLRSSNVVARISPRIATAVSTSIVLIDSDTTDQYNMTALAEICHFAAPTGTPVDGQKLTIRVLDNGNAQSLSFDIDAGGFAAIGVTLPTTTVAGKYLYVGSIWNAESGFWDVVSVAQQA